MKRYHDNLFAFTKGHEAYETLLRDQERDTKKYKWAGGVGLTVLFVAVMFENWVIAIIGAGVLLQGVLLFIDLSNRNFLLHAIDYAEWRRQGDKDATLGRDTYVPTEGKGDTL